MTRQFDAISNASRTNRWSGRQHAVSTLIAVGAVLLAAAFEVLMIDRYHGVSAGQSKFVLLGIQLILITGATWTLSRRWLPALSRFSFVTAVASWTWMVPFRGVETFGSTFGSAGSMFAVLVASAAVAGAAANLSVEVWQRLRNLVTVACVIFVLAQPVLVLFFAPHIQWPVLHPEATHAEAAPHHATLFVLLDELNANASEGIADELRAAGLSVVSKAIDPVDEATAKVIPAMWTRQDFGAAKACSLTAICSRSNMLDFARVRASMPDVDVIGMFHPYCAMQGLRWCESVGRSQPFFDWTRWNCGARLRLGFAVPQSCLQPQGAGWARFVEEMEAAMWRAPFWERGGFMFAHLPYPHPPGQHAGGSLSEHYAANLLTARATVARMMKKIQSQNFSTVEVVVFSDHPLREAYWCTTATYKGDRCAGVEKLHDTKVPLIVGVKGMTEDTSGIERNAQIFDLLGR